MIPPVEGRFEWDDAKELANRQKHGVSFEEAKLVFYDSFAIRAYDAEHSVDEDRYVIIGLSQRLRVLYVVHAEEMNGIVRIISARRATRTEHDLYEKGLPKNTR